MKLFLDRPNLAIVLSILLVLDGLACPWRIRISRSYGKLGPVGKPSVPIKGMWLYPLTRDFRSMLTQ